MKQKKILLVVAATLAAAPMMTHAANLEVYGQLRMAVTAADNGDSSPGQEDSTVAISSNDSRIGFRGNEKLKDNLTGLFQAEIQYNVDEDDGYTSWSSGRDSFVGLQGNWGTALVGRLSTPYKNATGLFDPFTDTEADFNGSGDKIISHNTRANNAIAYVSPNRNGLNYALAYATSVQNDELPQTSADADQDALSLSVTYEEGPLMVMGAYEKIEDEKAFAFGAQFAVSDKTRIGVLIDDVDDQDNTVYASLNHKLRDDYTLSAALAFRGDSGNGVNDGMEYFALGVSHSYTPTVSVFAQVAMVSNDSDSTVGLKKNEAVTGEDISALSVGMNISFSTK
ncbi:MAG: porin [Pseudomonadota bacterium]